MAIQLSNRAKSRKVMKAELRSLIAQIVDGAVQNSYHSNNGVFVAPLTLDGITLYIQVYNTNHSGVTILVTYDNEIQREFVRPYDTQEYLFGVFNLWE